VSWKNSLIFLYVKGVENESVARVEARRKGDEWREGGGSEGNNTRRNESARANGGRSIRELSKRREQWDCS
jgi:hypothetical protein